MLVVSARKSACAHQNTAKKQHVHARAACKRERTLIKLDNMQTLYEVSNLETNDVQLYLLFIEMVIGLNSAKKVT